MCAKVNTVLEAGKVSAGKMTLHDDEDKEYAGMKARYCLSIIFYSFLFYHILFNYALFRL